MTTMYEKKSDSKRPYDEKNLTCLVIMPPTLKKLMGHIAFGACVRGCVTLFSSPVQSTGRAIVLTLASALALALTLALPFPSRHF